MYGLLAKQPGSQLGKGIIHRTACRSKILEGKFHDIPCQCHNHNTFKINTSICVGLQFLAIVCINTGTQIHVRIYRYETNQIRNACICICLNDRIMMLYKQTDRHMYILARLCVMRICLRLLSLFVYMYLRLFVCIMQR